MTFRKLDLLTLLVSLFIFSACENPSEIGLEVNPDVALNSSLVDTITVTTQLMKNDSIVANYNQHSVLANFDDPEFGKTTSAIAAAVTLPSTGYSFGTDPTLDSAVLVLPFANFYGDSSNTSYIVEVHQLNEKLYASSEPIYYNTKHWQAKSQVLASQQFYPTYRDSITIQDIVSGGKDTVQRVVPQLRIKLDPQFITNAILKADSINKVSDDAFNTYFKGLYITLKTAPDGRPGGIFVFNSNAATDTRLDIFYKNTTSAGGTDTLQTSFPLNGSAGRVVSELNWDNTGTAAAAAFAHPDNPATIYLKGMVGTRLRIGFPYIKKLNELGQNIAINRAELILTPEEGSRVPFKPIPTLRIFRWDIAHQFQYLPDENSADTRYMGSGFVGGQYYSSVNHYIFNLTGYIQDLVSGRTPEYGTFISTYNLIDSSDKFAQPGRSVIKGNTSTSPHEVKLKVYYTDLK